MNHATRVERVRRAHAGGDSFTERPSVAGDNRRKAQGRTQRAAHQKGGGGTPPSVGAAGIKLPSDTDGSTDRGVFGRQQLDHQRMHDRSPGTTKEIDADRAVVNIVTSENRRGNEKVTRKTQDCTGARRLVTLVTPFHEKVKVREVRGCAPPRSDGGPSSTRQRVTTVTRWCSPHALRRFSRYHPPGNGPSIRPSRYAGGALAW